MIVADRLRELAETASDLPLPASGATAVRWERLFDVAERDTLSVARLFEAHLDALAILHEAGRSPEPGALYGVWASVSPNGPDLSLDGSRLLGTKSFCSGLGIVDRALIDVGPAGSRVLLDVDVDLRSPSVADAGMHWNTDGMVETRTGAICFDGHTDHEVVGKDGWYLNRPGFWHGACGPAACWAGGAAALLQGPDPRSDVFRQASIGRIAGLRWGWRAMLRVAGDEIDADPTNIAAAERRARSLRLTVHDTVADSVADVVRSFGPRPLVTSHAYAQRLRDLEVYLLQHHGRREYVRLDQMRREPS